MNIWIQKNLANIKVIKIAISLVVMNSILLCMVDAQGFEDCLKHKSASNKIKIGFMSRYKSSKVSFLYFLCIFLKKKWKFISNKMKVRSSST